MLTLRYMNVLPPRPLSNGKGKGKGKGRKRIRLQRKNVKEMYARAREIMEGERSGTMDEAYALLEETAILGHVQAMIDVADHHALHCPGTDEHEKLAIHWYEMAIKHGSADAMCMLSRFYRTRTKGHDDESIMLCEKAANLGHEDAISHMGWVYEYEKKDYEKAKMYYERGMAKGDKECDFRRSLASLYLYKLKQEEKGIQLYMEGWMLYNDAESMIELGSYYEDEKKDPTRAKEFYEKAANTGYKNGWYYLGSLYKHELDDMEMALQCYENAAKAGCETSEYHIKYIQEKHRINKVHQVITDDCAICHGGLDFKIPLTLMCGHMLHAKCLEKWFDGKDEYQCPICKRKVECDMLPEFIV